MTGAAPRPLADPSWLAAARRRPALWRLAAGVLLALAIYLAGAGAAVGVWMRLVARPEDAASAARAVGAFVGGETPGAMLFLLGTFAFMGLGAWAAARWLHRRRLGEIVGPRAAAWRDFRLAAAVVLVLNAGPVALAVASGEVALALDPALWALLLVPAIPLIALQTGAEELLFRGYLQGQLAARFRSPLVWAVLPSLAFGAAHWEAENGAAAWGILGATALFGLAAADLTAMTGRLGAAWGLHFANNLGALTLIGTQGALPGLALWRTPWALAEAPAAPALILFDMALLAVIWLAVRTLLRRRLQSAGAANTSPEPAPGSASGGPR